MVMIFIALFIAVISFNFFMMSYQINGVNNLVLSMPISLYETSINMLNINENVGPSFDKQALENRIQSYFDFSMKKYTKDYSLDFYYYNPFNHSICLSDTCHAVEVKVEASLILNYHYEKTMYYQIRSN